MSGKMTAKDVRDKLEDDTLDFSLCDLEEVPIKQILAVKRVSNLDLSNNSLVTLSRTFATLTSIVKLDLSKNMLTDLPDNFGDLKQLKHLDLYSNRISRLPLSLGELKNLKWLDLKENPLTPAVASVAGPCSNANECRACAKNIVTYLSKIKLTIDEEMQRRITVREILRTAKNEANNKNEAKKKKKNAEKKVSEKDKSPNVRKEKPQEKNNVLKNHKSKSENQYRSKGNNSEGGFFSSLCAVFTALIMWSFFFALLTIIIVAVFPLYDEQRSDEIFRYVETQSGVPLKHYRHEGIGLLNTFIEKTKLWTNHTRGLVEKAYQEYFIQETSSEEKKKF